MSIPTSRQIAAHFAMLDTAVKDLAVAVLALGELLRELDVGAPPPDAEAPAKPRRKRR